MIGELTPKLQRGDLSKVFQGLNDGNDNARAEVQAWFISTQQMEMGDGQNGDQYCCAAMVNRSIYVYRYGYIYI